MQTYQPDFKQVLSADIMPPQSIYVVLFLYLFLKYETEEDLKKFTDEELQQNLSATVHQVQALRKMKRK